MRRARFNWISIGDSIRLVAMLTIALALQACRDDRGAGAGSWEIQGPLLAWDDNVWVVDTVPIVVPDEIAAGNRLTLGATVVARGSVDELGQPVAKSVELRDGQPLEPTLPPMTVTGAIDRIDGVLWLVDEKEIVVAGGTPVRSDRAENIAASSIPAGAVADIAGYLLRDGRVIANDVVLRTQSEPSAQPKALVSPVEAADSAEPEPVPGPPAADTAQTATDENGDTSRSGDQQPGTDDRLDSGKRDGESRKQQQKQQQEKHEKPDTGKDREKTEKR